MGSYVSSITLTEGVYSFGKVATNVVAEFHRYATASYVVVKVEPLEDNFAFSSCGPKMDRRGLHKYLGDRRYEVGGNTEFPPTMTVEEAHSVLSILLEELNKTFALSWRWKIKHIGEF